MSLKEKFITAMIDSLGPSGIEYFASAEGLKLESLRVGFVAYVRDLNQFDDQTNSELFDVFIERVREAYADLRVH